jgi:hypothetical protein
MNDQYYSSYFPYYISQKHLIGKTQWNVIRFYFPIFTLMVQSAEAVTTFLPTNLQHQIPRRCPDSVVNRLRSDAFQILQVLSCDAVAKKSPEMSIELMS